jgi:viroplasmin and RNaseH domain-containing protein
MICQEELNGYSNNSYRGYETLEETQLDYHNFVDDQDMVIHSKEQPFR